MKYFKKVLVATICLGVSFLGFLYFRQEKIIFFPTKDYNEEVNDLGVEDVFLLTEDNVKIHALLKESYSNAKYVLFFHGNGGNVSHRIWQMKFFDEIGLNFMMVDYRGYGKSEGKIKREDDLYNDAEAAWNYLTEEKGIEQKNIIIWGKSLGGAVAIELAKRKDAGALVVESSFSSMVDMKNRQYSYVPNFLLKYKLESYKKIGKVTMPILIIHSKDDEMIDIENGWKNFKYASGYKKFLETKGDHNNGMIFSDSLYKDGIKNFLATLKNK